MTLALYFCSDPVVNSNSNERSSVKRLLEKLILEDDQFDVHEILPNTVPDPSSLILASDYACTLGQVVMAPDCGKILLISCLEYKMDVFVQFKFNYYEIYL